MLPPGLVHRNGGGVGQVQRPAGLEHRQSHQRRDVLILLHLVGQAHGFGAEEQHIAGLVSHLGVQGFSFGGEGEDAGGGQSRPCRFEVRVHGDHGQVVVVQTGAAQFGVFEVEAQRLDQMQLRTGHRGQTDGVAGIAGNFRSVKKDSEHGDQFTPAPVEPGIKPSRGVAAEAPQRPAGVRG
ncbi:hypothetical protein B857_03903 [Solibacillus isronensis B3W22]|uniref:Uncharacterized protein n=1 Tax=Solibacillus isronensis B3W22 TaxID=1224748 RepID=K1KXH9_9BACL|nr:hypothetical protein B857_03903 [Solibacillus isronensis B3W22]